MASIQPPPTWDPRKNDTFTSPPSFQPAAAARIAPAILFILVILAVVFFISGLLHLLLRLLFRPPASASFPGSPLRNDSADAAVDSRQLQQLFHLHDSGVDQALIDSLPVFSFRSILGRRHGDSFDCAVCLCEFDPNDNLRLLPNCSHAFHLPCIDTWLLSNSTCPLCRGTVLPVHDQLPNPPSSLEVIDDDHRQRKSMDGYEAKDEIPRKKVVAIKLGRYKCVSEGSTNNSNGPPLGETSNNSSTFDASASSSTIDGRRCFSMGSYQYIVGDSSLCVTVKPRSGGDEVVSTTVGESGDLEGGKRLSGRSRGDSYSISKIWMWPRKGPLVREHV